MYMCYTCMICTGRFDVPSTCLQEPLKAFRLRESNMLFVQYLKQEIINNPLKSVSPMIGMLCEQDSQDFDKTHPEACTYYVIGKRSTCVYIYIMQ